MTSRRARFTGVPLALTVCIVAPAAAQQAPGAPPLDPAAVETNIREALASRIDTAGVGVGTIVGILTPEGRRYIAHGRTEKNGAVEPDADTVFEIGSITKVFTALLLAEMVERGEVALDDEIARYLPADVRVPTRNGKAITLADLATHTSGLPRLPTNLQALDLVDPYAAYGPTQLHEFLSGYELPRDPGETWEYSNVGAGLLGHVLARRAGTSYEALLRARILDPLGMHDTTITLSPEQRARMATGHDLAMNPTGPWAFDALAGAGALRSTASDMLTFAAAQLGLVPHPLEAAMRRMVALARPAGSPAMQQHLGWIAIRGLVLFHDGGTGGFRSAITVRPDLRRAVIVLSNSFQDVNDLALHGVVQQQPLTTFERPVAIELSGAVLDTYVGTYETGPGASVEITRSEARLYAQPTGQPRSEIAAIREDQFFVSNPTVRISFVKDDAGTVTGLIVQIGGATVPARRVR